MSPINLANVMDEIGTKLNQIAGLNVHAFVAKKITPPAAMVLLPESITFDETYGRGSDKMTIPVLLLVGNVSDRAATASIASYADGKGASSVKEVLESGTYTSCDSVRVRSAEDFDVVTIAAVDYLGATFQVDIQGSGA